MDLSACYRNQQCACYRLVSQGIVFSVRPPKKSWRNIANLSGGEKTLSSLSLVFALHHFRPTPLYVMDEIDAALGALPCFHPFRLHSCCCLASPELRGRTCDRQLHCGPHMLFPHHIHQGVLRSTEQHRKEALANSQIMLFDLTNVHLSRFAISASCSRAIG